MMYGGHGFGGIIWLLVMGVLLVVPFWKILPRNGIPSWVAIFAAIPLVALILLWVVAFKDDVKSSGGQS